MTPIGLSLQPQTLTAELMTSTGTPMDSSDWYHLQSIAATDSRAHRQISWYQSTVYCIYSRSARIS